jgi:hypothetical protein
MTALKRPPSWDEAKKALGEANFMEKLIRFNKDSLDDPMIKKLSKFTSNKEFSPESVGKVSGAARGMCLWVHAMKVHPSARPPSRLQAAWQCASHSRDVLSHAVKCTRAGCAGVW